MTKKEEKKSAPDWDKAIAEWRKQQEERGLMKRERAVYEDFSAVADDIDILVESRQWELSRRVLFHAMANELNVIVTDAFRDSIPLGLVYHATVTNLIDAYKNEQSSRQRYGMLCMADDTLANLLLWISDNSSREEGTGKPVLSSALATIAFLVEVIPEMPLGEVENCLEEMEYDEEYECYSGSTVYNMSMYYFDLGTDMARHS